MTYEEWTRLNERAEEALNLASSKMPSDGSHCVYVISDARDDRRDQMLLVFDTEKEMADAVSTFGALLHWPENENIDVSSAIASLKQRKNLTRRSLNAILAGISQYEFLGLWKHFRSGKKYYVRKTREDFWQTIDPDSLDDDSPIPDELVVDFVHFLRTIGPTEPNDD